MTGAFFERGSSFFQKLLAGVAVVFNLAKILPRLKSAKFREWVKRDSVFRAHCLMFFNETVADHFRSTVLHCLKFFNETVADYGSQNTLPPTIKRGRSPPIAFTAAREVGGLNLL